MFEQEEKIIDEFLKSIGPWRNHIVIGGGYALIIYKLFLTELKNGNSPVGTTDLDSLIPRKVPVASEKNIHFHLKNAGFKRILKSLEIPATEAYVKEINGYDIEVEFLTDNMSRHQKDKNIIISGVVAQPLNYLHLSLQKTLSFETTTNEVGIVVSPSAWMFHKGLTFPKRPSESKKLKDLYGIWYVATQLGDFSEQAVAELKVLFQQNPKWFKTFQGNLSKWRKNLTPLDSIKLEAQDPSGVLKMAHFDYLISSLID